MDVLLNILFQSKFTGVWESAHVFRNVCLICSTSEMSNYLSTYKTILYEISTCVQLDSIIYTRGGQIELL